METPEYLENMGREAEYTWLAFSQLSARRPYEQGSPKHISMEAIWCYVDLALGHLDEDEVEDLLWFLQVLDDRFLEIKHKALEKSRKKAGKGSRRGR